jgi:translation elongation factor EF-G
MWEASMNNSPLLVSVTIEPKLERDWEELVEALARLSAGAPGLRVSDLDVIGGTQALLEAASEERLKAAVALFLELSPVEAVVGAPRVAYRERLSRRQEIDFTHKRPGQFARVKLVFDTDGAGGEIFENRAPETSVPAEFVDGVERGVVSVVESGVILGRPVVELKAALVDGAGHGSDSSVLAFEIAARAATREALARSSELLEPIMSVETTAPNDVAEAVVADLRGRRAQALKAEQGDETTRIAATAPLAELLGYGEALSALTKGRASHDLRFSHYAPTTPEDDMPPRPTTAARPGAAA